MFCEYFSCFVNTFQELNSGCYVQMGKIFGTIKKWLLVMSDKWLFYAA